MHSIMATITDEAGGQADNNLLLLLRSESIQFTDHPKQLRSSSDEDEEEVVDDEEDDVDERGAGG